MSIYQILDDEGFFAIIDPDAYQTYVDYFFSLTQIASHFKEQMVHRHLLIWGTGFGADWNVQVNNRITQTMGLKETTGSIYVSEDRLCFTTYSELARAAGNERYSLPNPRDWGWIIPIPSGTYHCRIVQLHTADNLESIGESNPKGNTNEDIDFLIEFERTDTPLPAWPTIPWSDLGETTL